MSKKSPTYEDFITNPIEVMKFLGKDQMKLMDEYLDIMRALSQKPMTVKAVSYTHLTLPTTPYV